MIYELPCPHCNGAVSADSEMAGEAVKCPLCGGEFELPAAEETSPPSAPPTLPTASGEASTSPAASPRRQPIYRFHLTCPRCDSQLEAHTGQTGHPAQCPSCASRFIVPHYDPETGDVGPLQDVSGDEQDPTPVHAYAANGANAPKIIESEDGQRKIRCPRCGFLSPLDADRCEPCGMPFTLEGVVYQTVPGATNGYAIASLVLSLLGLTCMVLFLPQILGVVFGVIALRQLDRKKLQRGRGLAWAGILLGVIGLVIAALTVHVRF